jgi:hypothetical protein
MIGILAALLLMATLAPAALADSVLPSEEVRSRVVLREKATRNSPPIGSLRPGDRAEHLASEQGWHRVRLADGTTGFVSAAWTEVVVEIPEDPVDLEEIAQPRRSFFGAIAGFFRGLFRSEQPVEFEIREPDPRASVYRHTDPNLPVSGVARSRGAGRLYDLMLAIDASTSTNEHAEADVDRDGKADDDWMGRDSIFKAQISAAANLVRVLDRLPGNDGGGRVRVGLVTYAGEERFRLDPEDEDLPLAFEAVYAQAARDARVALPLTSDYPAAVRKLELLWHTFPIGMTNVAAGIGRSVVELTGDAERGATSEPRPDADKSILLLTDGKPRLPYDKLLGERMAMYAGKLASRSGVRINVFALGYNEVTRAKKNYSLKRMSLRSGGRYVALERPGEIMTALGSTPFSVVDRVRLRNHTSGHYTRNVATGIDGSFYGEVPLLEGENEIEITAFLDDGRTASESFRVDYVHGLPPRELEEQLKRLRFETAALTERVRDSLVTEMEENRRSLEQRRHLELKVRDGSPLPPPEP